MTKKLLMFVLVLLFTQYTFAQITTHKFYPSVIVMGNVETGEKTQLSTDMVITLKLNANVDQYSYMIFSTNKTFEMKSAGYDASGMFLYKAKSDGVRCDIHFGFYSDYTLIIVEYSDFVFAYKCPK